MAWLEKQGETFTKKDVDDAYLKGVCDTKQEFEKQGELNPAWSEEDEINYNYALAACKYYGEAKGYADTETHQKTNNWLKSLKDRVGCEVNCTTTKEWSKEDECYISECIGAIATKDGLSFEEKRKTKHWLESLKGRCTWNPSDEQMEAFEHFVRSFGESGYASPYDNNTKLLYSLLWQLKKLK